MAAAIGLITVGGIMLASGILGVSVTDLIAGAVTGKLNPAGGRKTFAPSDTASSAVVGGAVGAIGGTAKDVIDNAVLPIARSHGINVTPESVAAANGRHGPTITGSQSDHQGPPERAWAADMSNGPSPTPEMDALARDLANKFDIPWTGSGLANKTVGQFRYQLIYRTFIGGNHMNHVHFGVRVVG